MMMLLLTLLLIDPALGTQLLSLMLLLTITLLFSDPALGVQRKCFHIMTVGEGLLLLLGSVV